MSKNKAANAARAYDVFVVGSGPAGQKAAVQCAKAGLRVAICEQLREVGGACVHHGTIPSKALRERAIERYKAHRLLSDLQTSHLDMSVGVGDLIGEMTDVIRAHDRYMSAQLERNSIDIVHGRASFVDPHTLKVRHTDGSASEYRANYVVLATGSKPRKPDNVAVDHEHIYDSDSILSVAYLPQTMVVLGGGVIACEYASIFAVLGVKVTLIDRYPKPLGFLDQDLSERFLQGFERRGGVFIGNMNLTDVRFDGVSQVETQFEDGTVIRSEKVLCALGRISQVAGLNLEASGVSVNERDLIPVNEHGQTAVRHIYAAGDVIGPPSLASASMEQGRRVACHILGVDTGAQGEWMPSGIYSVPELASVGLTQAQAEKAYGNAAIGIAHFSEIARGQISDAHEGMLKLVVAPDRRILGVHVVGAQASDLVHIGQMGLIHGATLDTYIENVFNFPTYAESYRVAALDAANRMRAAGTGSSMEVA